jgi:hypothetical protein
LSKRQGHKENKKSKKRGPDLYRRDKEYGGRRREEGERWSEKRRGDTYLSQICVGGLQTFSPSDFFCRPKNLAPIK